ncbi:hypothetical protein [Kitasatospora sp. NPDC059327]
MAAAPALPRIHAELARPRRNRNFFAGIEGDEALQQSARAIIDRLT